MSQATQEQQETTSKRQSRARSKRTSNWVLAQVDWTAETVDKETGKIIPGRRCFVEVPLPPNLDRSKPLTRASIQRAVRSAVYDEGLEEYGNKVLVVLNYGESFEIEYEKKHLTILCPPEKEEDDSATDDK